jgi:misacylated tRNA(Ala) deacylase
MTAANGAPSKGRAVGALACQSSSYQKTLDTEVVSCAKATKIEQNGGKKSKKKEEEPVEDQWLIECADSVLFPEGEAISRHDHEP